MGDFGSCCEPQPHYILAQKLSHEWVFVRVPVCVRHGYGVFTAFIGPDQQNQQKRLHTSVFICQSEEVFSSVVSFNMQCYTVCLVKVLT